MLYEQDGRSFVAVGSKDAQLYLYDRGTHALILRKELARRLNVTEPLSSAQPVHVCPGNLGGVEWFGPAYDPVDRMLFVNSVDRCATFKVEEDQASGTLLGRRPGAGPADICARLVTRIRRCDRRGALGLSG